MSRVGRLPAIPRRGRTYSFPFLLLILLTGMPICAQEYVSEPAEAHSPVLAELPTMSRPLPATPVVIEPSLKPPVPHAFWDRRNCLLFTGIGLFRALDYASTRNMQARGREEILLPDE